MKDLEPLLQPISEATPCGADLSFSAEFDAIEEMRREDDPTLPQGEFVIDRKVADWSGVAELTERLLATSSKDLRVAGWLGEAWAHLHGFSGLADGLLLVEQLCLGWWAELHPGTEDDEYEMRIGNLAWVLARTESLSRSVAVLRGATRGFGIAQIEALRAAEAAGEPPGKDGDLAKIQRETPRDFLSANLVEAERALAALRGLQDTLDTLLGDESPNFAPARKALEAAQHVAQRHAREGGVQARPAPAPSSTTVGAAGAAGSVGIGAGSASTMAPTVDGPLQSRAQALHQLRQVAEFFRRTEPHSPVAYLADKAAQWGELPLHAWLRAVVKDGAALAQLEDLLGVAPANDGNNG